MKGEMRNRLALLSVLLVGGLLMAGIGTAMGAGGLLKFAGKQVSAVAMNDQLKIYEDGKLVEEITLPKGEYSIETSGHKIVFRKMTKEEIAKAQAEHEKEMEKWIEIVNKDSRIQELTNGKSVQSKEVVSAITGNGDEIILMVKVEGRYYKIAIDLNSETVKSMEEKSSAVMENCYGSDGPTDCSELPATARYWSRVHK
ncbi:hypothetical protein DRN74_00860 [Candidatus Micrarchaeota archaeon]|nr:MAG: hypothetical protein DRN74_00860 [Candidatus Micrarchaeota archaeon]